jgi:hypothetical protein
MKTIIKLLILTLLGIHCAIAGGSISWEDVKSRIAKTDPELVKVIENYFIVNRSGGGVRLGPNFGERHGERIAPYEFGAEEKKTKEQCVLVIEESEGYEFTGRFKFVKKAVEAQNQEAEQSGAGQPTNRSESEPEDGEKEEAVVDESVESYSHLKNKWVIFCGAGVAKINLNHPEFETVIIFDHQPTAEELIKKMQEIIGEKTIIELYPGIQTSEPYGFTISAGKVFNLGWVDQKRKWNLSLPKDYKIPNFCQVLVGINEFGIARAAARLAQQEGKHHDADQPATAPESKPERDQTPKPESEVPPQ